MSWTHPSSWKQLRSLELRVYRAGKAVARIRMSPGSGHPSAGHIRVAK
jgi:hypothetical protein